MRPTVRNWAYVNLAKGETVDIADPKTQPPSPYYYAKVRFIGYYENNETKEGSGNITIEYALQDDGTRSFIESVPTSVDAQRKLTTTWAAIKSNYGKPDK